MTASSHPGPITNETHLAEIEEASEALSALEARLDRYEAQVAAK